MNKAEVIERLAQDNNLSKADVERIVDSLSDLIRKTVRRGEEVKLSGLGTFTKTRHRARMGAHPHSGKPIRIPAFWHPKFRPGKEFKSAVE